MHGGHGLIGSSKCFLQVTGMIPLLSASRSTVLISGETGTGKELLARAIHYSGERRGKPFVPVNCAALPDHLIENELFGHCKGAFTGALSEKMGLFHEAAGGTLLLDEINSLSLLVQSKLLRVLQDREFRPLGSTKSRTVDVRIIAATNTDLRNLVETKQFREDLYHRLNVLSISIPPLRERRQDIPLLANHFLKVIAREHGRGEVDFSSLSIRKLAGYGWPGNVRELDGVVQRAVLMSTSSTIEPEDIELPEREVLETVMDTTVLPSLGVGRLRDEQGFQKMKAQVIEEFERAFLSQLLAAYQGNISKAARAAKKERRSFQRLLQKYGLDRRVFGAAAIPQG